MTAGRIRALALSLAFAGAPAAALTPGDVDAAAALAAGEVRAHIEKLAADRMAGRDNGTRGGRRARKYLAKQLKRVAEPLGSGRKRFFQRFEREGDAGANVLAVIRGRELPDEYVVLGAHYDHLGVGGCGPELGTSDLICNGATDNASGSAAVLAVASAVAALPEAPRRSVVLALWDAEEDGLQGSEHYVENPLVPLSQTVTYVNLDILGATLLPSLASNTFVIGSETGGTPVTELVAAAAAPHDTVAIAPLSYVFGQQRGDYFPFGQAGVPVVWYADSSSACYHTAGDELSRVDFEKLAEQTAIALRTVVGLAEMDPAPSFVAPAPGPGYEDAVSLQKLLGLSVPADLGLFPAPVQADITELATLIDQIVLDGPAAFDEADSVSVIATAAVLSSNLEALPCPAW